MRQINFAATGFSIVLQGYPEIANQIQHDLQARVTLAQSGSASDLREAGITKDPASDWIIVPMGEKATDFPAPNVLLQSLLQYKGHSIQFTNAPAKGVDGLIKLTAFPITVYVLDSINLLVKTEGSGAESVKTFSLEQLWTRLPKGDLFGDA